MFDPATIETTRVPGRQTTQTYTRSTCRQERQARIVFGMLGLASVFAAVMAVSVMG